MVLKRNCRANLALSADFGPSELLSVLDSGITVNFLPLWCESLVLGHLWNRQPWLKYSFMRRQEGD